MAKIRDKQPDADAGRVKVDEQLEGLEARLTSIYTQAGNELKTDLSTFLDKYEKQDSEKKAQVESGDLTEKDYTEWRERQIFRSDAMQAKIDDLSTRIVNVDQQAMAMVNNQLPETYATSYNFGGYRAETQANAAGFDYTQFTIINQDAVRVLATEDPDLIPWQADPDVEEDKKWNRQHVQEAIQQGIVKGDSMDDVAKRLLPVVNMDKNAAIRTARTAVNGVENKGRKDATERVREAGIPMVETWSCTHDDRTRDTHILLDGTTADDNGMFGKGILAKLMAYPGDPAGDPAEVYNCRCSLVSSIKGIDHSKDDELYAKMMEEEYFDDWVQVKEDRQEKEDAFQSRKEGAAERVAERQVANEGTTLEEQMDAIHNYQQVSFEGITSEEKGALADYINSNDDVEERLSRGMQVNKSTIEEWINNNEVQLNDMSSWATDGSVANQFSTVARKVDAEDGMRSVIIVSENGLPDSALLPRTNAYDEKEVLTLTDKFEIISYRVQDVPLGSGNASPEQYVIFVKPKEDAEEKLETETEPAEDKLQELGIKSISADDIDLDRLNFIDGRFGKYAYELGEEMQEMSDDNLIVELRTGNHIAYASIDEESSSLDGIVSDGGGSGTELLGRVMEYQESKGEGLIWMADNSESISYYDHLGLDKWGEGSSSVKTYEIPPEEMKEALEKVNEHRDIEDQPAETQPEIEWGGHKGSVSNKTKEIENIMEVDEKEARRYRSAIEGYSDGDFQLVRQAQQGNNSEYKAQADRIEAYIEKAPKWDGGEISRGLSFSNPATVDAIVQKVENGEPIDMMGMTSWSSNKDVALNFADADISSRTSVIFVNEDEKCDCATSIQYLSLMPYQDEVLVSGNADFQPTRYEQKDGVTYIYGHIRRKDNG